MAHRWSVRVRFWHRRLGRPGALLAFALVFLSSCSGQLPPVISETPTPVVPGKGGVVPAPASAYASLLALPPAFRYVVTLHPVLADAPTTVVTGQYRSGAWAQTSRTGEQAGDDLIVAVDPATGSPQSYTRAAGDTSWTRWPGVTFEAAYGLASPFTVLRLRSLATRSAVTGPSSGQGATPESGVAPGETRTQALFSTEVVQRMLLAGVVTTATDEDTKAALEAQVSSLFVPQTVTYWTDSAGKVTKAAATLLSLGPDNESVPWIELTTTYFGYDDPAIAVAAPANATDIAAITGGDASTAGDAVAEQASDVQPGTNLRLRVFATAGVPATDSVVTAYPTGKKTVAGKKLGPDAQFALKAGTYDVSVSSGGAQQVLKGVAVAKDSLASTDVLFDFAQLIVGVVLNGAAPASDVVVYPVGEKTQFAGFVSTNPARFQLPAGLYDVEAATQDGRARKRVSGVEVRGGLETALTVDLSQP